VSFTLTEASLLVTSERLRFPTHIGRPKNGFCVLCKALVLPTWDDLACAEDVAGRRNLCDRLRTLLSEEPTPQTIIVDLAGVSYIETSGIATLIEALRMARHQQTNLRFAGKSWAANGVKCHVTWRSWNSRGPSVSSKNSRICSDCEHRPAIASLIFVIVSGTAVASTKSWQL
jgi:hypothetical protein